MTEQDKVTVDDIIGIVKTEEQTNSVEEVRKLRGRGNETAKRFEVVMNEFDEVEYIMDKVMMEDRDFAEFIDFVEDVCKENEQLKYSLAAAQMTVRNFNRLKEENEQLKTTIQQLRTDNTKQKKKLNTAMKENEQLKIALKDKENLISICEKKFKELGYLITCDDDEYVIE